MDGSEAIGLVWEALAKTTAACSSLNIIDATGIDGGVVRRALAGLRENKLVDVHVDRAPLFSYTLVRELDALGWARAVDLGVPLSVLETHAKLASGVRDEALRLALAGRLDVLGEQARERKRAARTEVIEGKLASRIAATDLAQLVSDTRAAASMGRFRPMASFEQANEQACAGSPAKPVRKVRGGKVREGKATAKSAVSSEAAMSSNPQHPVSLADLTPSERAVQEILERAQDEANRALGTLLNHMRAGSA